MIPKVGQKVVCTVPLDVPWGGAHGMVKNHPRPNGVYTIRGILVQPSGLGLYFDEIRNSIDQEFVNEPAFRVEWFSHFN